MVSDDVRSIQRIGDRGNATPLPRPAGLGACNTTGVTWIAAQKVSGELTGGWPATLRGLASWASSEAPSIYSLLRAREIIENYIRADAEDATAIANIVDSPEMPPGYTTETIQAKIEALRVTNIRITALGLDSYTNVTAHMGLD